MSAPPSGGPLGPPDGGVIVTCENLSTGDYLALYREVGETLDWDVRLRMSETALATFLAEPTTRTFVLRDARQSAGRGQGSLVGPCEFDCASWPQVELVHFGLVPSAQGHKLGPYFLDVALRACWALRPERIWLHTDTNDHPAAIKVYERSGFTRYLTCVEQFDD